MTVNLYCYIKRRFCAIHGGGGGGLQRGHVGVGVPPACCKVDQK